MQSFSAVVFCYHGQEKQEPENPIWKINNTNKVNIWKGMQNCMPFFVLGHYALPMVSMLMVMRGFRCAMA